MGRRGGDRLAAIRDRAGLEDALAVAPDPAVPPAGLAASDQVLWRDYCRYYRRRLEAISEGIESGAGSRPDPPRSFASYLGVVAVRGRVRDAACAQGDEEEGTSGGVARMLPKAVLPPRVSPVAAGEAAGPGPVTPAGPGDLGGGAGAGRDAPPILRMSAREIMAQIERDVDAAAAGEAGGPVRLRYDGECVPLAVRPAMLEYAQQYAQGRWGLVVHIAY